MFRTPTAPTHRAPGRAVIDYRGLAAPVGRSLGGVAALGAVTAGAAITGAGAAQASVPQLAPRSASPVSAQRTAIAPAPARVTSVPMVSLSRGARGHSVSQLQTALNRHGASLTVDGSFGPATLRAVRAFQSQAGLTVDGKAGALTWAALGEAPTTTPTPAPSESARPTLRQGSRGAAVATLQKALRAHGATLTVDSSFGASTRASVTAFQSSLSLSADGVVGARTWKALDGSSGSAKTPTPTPPPTPGTTDPGTGSDDGSGSSSGSRINGPAIVASARAELGTPYVWGGQKPGVGFDCSGLTSYVYRLNGITIPRTARAQVMAGRIIPESEAKPGDLVGFTQRNYGHVGIYVGNGEIIDAGGSKHGVVYRKIWNAPHVFVTFR